MAWLPIVFLAEQHQPSERFALEVPLDEGYREVVTASLWAYLLHGYLALIGSYFGDDVAHRVWRHQRMILDAELGGSAATNETSLDLIDAAGQASRVAAQRWQSGVGFPPDREVATTLVLGLPGEPGRPSSKVMATSRSGRNPTPDCHRCVATRQACPAASIRFSDVSMAAALPPSSVSSIIL